MTENEIYEALNSLKGSKAGGKNGVHPELWLKWWITWWTYSELCASPFWMAGCPVGPNSKETYMLIVWACNTPKVLSVFPQISGESMFHWNAYTIPQNTDAHFLDARMYYLLMEIYNRRDICLAKDAGSISYPGLPGYIKTGCMASPAFKSRFCLQRKFSEILHDIYAKWRQFIQCNTQNL